jgi:diketogulonate reductase-like aldo/keto reductase
MIGQRTVTLNNGAKMPQLGLGVYQVSPGESTVAATSAAISIGYRHIDTARFYRNERDVGRAVAESGVPREQIFVTTKLANDDHGYDQTLRAFDQALRDLGFQYVDLYLIHWPVHGKRRDSWRAMERLYREGRCRSIGVSNYTIRHLEELLGESEVVPAVNQVELSPFLPQVKLRDFCQAKGIQVESYSPLTQGQKLSHGTVVSIAKKHGRTPAQVMLRWAVEHGLVVIPKSVRAERIEENAKIFDFALDQKDLTALDGLDENFRTCWDPTNAP